MRKRVAKPTMGGNILFVARDSRFSPQEKIEYFAYFITMFVSVSAMAIGALRLLLSQDDRISIWLRGGWTTVPKHGWVEILAGFILLGTVAYIGRLRRVADRFSVPYYRSLGQEERLQDMRQINRYHQRLIEEQAKHNRRGRRFVAIAVALFLLVTLGLSALGYYDAVLPVAWVLMTLEFIAALLYGWYSYAPVRALKRQAPPGASPRLRDYLLAILLLATAFYLGARAFAYFR